MNNTLIDELKIIMSDLIRNPKTQDEKYKSAYVDGVLDFFHKVSQLMDRFSPTSKE